VFRRFFEVIVERGAAAGLVWGKELSIDATKMVANASVETVTPRFALAARAHLDDLFAIDEGAMGPQPPVLPTTPEPVRIGPAEGAASDLAAANTARHDWLVQGGRQDRTRHYRDYLRPADRVVSTTDPDATHLPFRDGTRLGYQGHYLVDGGKARIILGALATPGEVPDRSQQEGLVSKDAVGYNPLADTYTCPAGATLSYVRAAHPLRLLYYQAPAATCNVCPRKVRCTTTDQGRMISRHVDEDFLDRVRIYQQTEVYHKARRKRGVWVEPLFAEAKDWHGLRRCRLRRLWRVNVQVFWTAGGQNLKRLPARQGWGRRPFPAAPGVRIDPWTPLATAC
jgi:hypothetical protein